MPNYFKFFKIYYLNNNLKKYNFIIFIHKTKLIKILNRYF